MVTLQNHVLSILAKSAKSAADDIIKLFDSSFEAFSEELRKRQDEIDTLRSKLEESEPKSVGPNSSGPAYLCVQCGVSLNCVISIEDDPKDHGTGNESPPEIETEFTDQPMLHAPIIESETEEGFEFEVTADDDDTSYSEQIQKDNTTACTETVHREAPITHKVPISPQFFPQKRGRGRPRKHPIPHVGPGLPFFGPQKRGRGRPRKTEVVVTLKSQPNMFSTPEQPKKAQTQKEIAKKPQHVKPAQPIKPQYIKPAQPLKLQPVKPEQPLKPAQPVTPQQMKPVQPVQSSSPQTSINHSLSKEEPQTKPNVQLQLARSVRRGRGRPPRRLLDPLLIPFAGTKSILSAPMNHVCEPVALTNELEDKVLPKTETLVPVDDSEKGQPAKQSPIKQKVWVKCPSCPRQYSSKSKMQAHKKTHHKKGVTACHVCGMTFVGTSQMNNHLRVHTGEKPFSCNFCDRRFPNQSQYNKHMLKHTAPDYACEVCGLRASQVHKDTFRKAHLRSKVPCSNCASIYT